MQSLLQENFGTSASGAAGNPCAEIAQEEMLKVGRYKYGKYKCEGRGLPGLRKYYYFFLAAFFLPAFFFAFFFAAIIVSLKVNLGIV
ncbi:MAG: hypothetical protein K2X06_13795 [Burkholderiales bacterium]|nr:hypothetical protein [Burkholderiales bacterium]